jgi:hypothetical protein
MSDKNDIKETSIKVSVYTCHSYIEDEKRFTGLHTIEAYKKIPFLVFRNLEESEKRFGKDKISFLKSLYTRHETQAPVDSYYELSSSVTDEEKAVIWSIFHKYEKNGNEITVHLTDSDSYKNNPPVLIDQKAVKKIRNRYIDVFREDQDTHKVYLRCEIFAASNGLLKNVPVRNLSDSRQPEGNGSETFDIPADDKCWIMLSDTKLSSKRLQNIIDQLEKKGICNRVTPVCGKLKQMQDTIKAGKKIPQEWYTQDRDCENVFVKDSTITIVLTDYLEQGRTLQTECEDLRLGIDNFLGRTTGSSSDRLKYLVCSTADARDKWNCLKTGKNDGDLKKNYDDFLRKQSALSCVAECFAYWITQPQFSEVMYDGLYGCSAGLYEKSYEGLYNAYYRLIQNVAGYPSTLKILSEYSERALNNYETALSLKNGGKDVSGYWDDEERTSTLINDNFKLLELYKTLDETPCFLVEVLYPQAKNIHEIFLKILDCFAKPIVWAGGKRFNTHVPHYMAKVLKKITKEKRIIVTEYTDLRMQWKLPGVIVNCCGLKKRLIFIRQLSSVHRQQKLYFWRQAQAS